MAAEKGKVVYSINFEGLSVGNSFEVSYTAPKTERISVNLFDECDNILLHVDYRVDYGESDTIVLNTRTVKRGWGREQRVVGIKSTPGTVLDWVICAREEDYSIVLNQKEVATYDYRIKAAVTRLEYQRYEKSADSTLKKLARIDSTCTFSWEKVDPKIQ